MHLESLKIYQDVVKSGSFSIVARDREVSPSSITRVINQLENALGVRLLQRSTRKIGLTEAGQLFFNRIAPLLEELERTQSEIRDLSSKPKGRIRITASPSFGTAALAPALVKFERQYPELKIDLVLTDQVLDLLENNIDLAIRQGPLVDSSLIAQRLANVRYRVCASPRYLKSCGHPKHPNELSHHRCLVFSLTNFRDRWKFRREGDEEFIVPIDAAMQVNNGLVLRHWALENTGIVMLSDWLISQDIAEGRLVDVFPEYEMTATDFQPKVWLIFPSRNYIPEKVNLLSGFLKAYFN